MIDFNDIEPIYMQNLERDIISEIAELKGIGYENAMFIYFNSRVAELIEKKSNDIQFLDYKYLANEIVKDNEGK